MEWFCANLAEAKARIQGACEKSWKDCYYWEGNEMSDDEEYFIQGVRIPPNDAPEWIPNPRDKLLAALIVLDFEQDWEVEHGFYVVLDPIDSKGDRWTTWDGLYEMGLVHLEDE